MSRFRRVDRTDLSDALLGAMALVYLLGFVAAIGGTPQRRSSPLTG